MRYPVSLALLLLFFNSISVKGQASFALGPAVQLYPTGIIPGVEARIPLSQDLAFDLRIGYNVVRHGDAGVHSDERGGGAGGSIGFTWHITEAIRGWTVGVRSDVWFNEVDWEDRDGDQIIRSGTSDVTVVQPTAVAGYKVPVGQRNTILIPTLALGAEINVKTDGGAVGQGAILLAGFTILFQTGNQSR